jgi:zinc transporter ZupT
MVATVLDIGFPAGGYSLTLAGESLEGNSPGPGAWIAVALITAATLAGAWLARRNAEKSGLWLSLASAIMLATAMTDIIPDVWRESVNTGLPLWVAGAAGAFGFLVVTYFTRKGCAHGHEDESPRPGRHAPGRHRRVKEAVQAVAFGGMGTAAALTTHRVIEGATLALIVSLPIILALAIHSASEGVTLAAMLGEAKQRLFPWLVTSAVSPAVGVIIATFRPLPVILVPVLLALVGGVLLRTAVVGMKLAASKRKSGELGRRHMAASIAVASALGTLMVLAH